MSPQKQLKTLYERGAARAAKLRALSLKGVAQSFVERDRMFCYVVIESHNLWTEFCRAFILSCVDRPYSIQGNMVTLSNTRIRSQSDALHAATKCAFGKKARAPKTRRDEPSWHESRLFLQVCREMGCSNLPTIQGALSTGTSVFGDLPKVRHFFAHRNDETKSRARDVSLRYALPRLPHPTLILSLAAPQRPQPLIVDWLDDLTTTMELLCQ